MARPIKQGLEYYPNDVDIHDDDKVALISSEFGSVGEAILWRLFCKIYKNGYYYSWGGDECLLFCRWAGGIFVPGQVDEVVKGCLRRSIFDNRVFEMFGILTSTGIQKRYLQATTERKEVELKSEIWLLELPENSKFKVIRPINEVNPTINEVNQPESTQSKVKESKVEDPPLPPKGDESEIPPVWKKDFKIYLNELRTDYKTLIADSEWISQQEKFNPGVDIQKSIEKSCVNYWATEAGWKKKKGSKIKSIDWKSTFANAIPQPMNRVYKERSFTVTESESSKEPHKPNKW
jgi:hypothetical protein